MMFIKKKNIETKIILLFFKRVPARKNSVGFCELHWHFPSLLIIWNFTLASNRKKKISPTESLSFLTHLLFLGSRDYVEHITRAWKIHFHVSFPLSRGEDELCISQIFGLGETLILKCTLFRSSITMAKRKFLQSLYLCFLLKVRHLSAVNPNDQ